MDCNECEALLICLFESDRRRSAGTVLTVVSPWSDHSRGWHSIVQLAVGMDGRAIGERV